MVLKILMVSPFPPARDGLASYASQVAADLRSSGHEVVVISPQPSAARYWERLRTFGGLARTTRVGRTFDKIIIQYHPEIYFTGMEPSRFARGWLGLFGLLTLSRNVEVVVHETAYSEQGRTGPIRMQMWRWLWGRPAKVVVHTETERRLMESTLAVSPDRIVVVDHGASFRKRTSSSREEARQSMGIDDGSYMFLCIGFLQPHKGFDRAAAALVKLEGTSLRLDIVGELRVWTPEHEEYVTLLEKYAASDRRIHLHQGYVSDELFDRWLVAADRVVLPYREIWSSGVVERAELYNRPVIVTDVGGIAEQVRVGSRVVHDADGLARAMAEASGAAVSEAASPEDSASTPTWRAQRRVEVAAQRLAEWYNPLAEFDLAEVARRNSDPRAGRLVLPPPNPGIRPKALLQRAIRRLVGWQLDPLVRYINALRNAVMGEAESIPIEEPKDSVG